MKSFFKVLTVVMIIVGFGSTAPAIGAYPEKTIEFITHSSPGGGSDIFARHLTDMIGQEKIVPVPMVVVNKSGAGGGIAVSYVATKKGDPHIIFATSTAIYATLIKGEVPVSLADFTPICGLVLDPNVIIVRGDSPYKNLKDFIVAAKKVRKGLNLGITSPGGSDHIAAHRIMKATGAEFNVVSFRQGTEANMALLGGHIDFVISAPNETAGQVQAGKLRLLATTTAKRLPYLPNVPTLKEEGVNAVFDQIRGIWGTKDLSQDVVSYWETRFNKITKTNAWKKYLENENILDYYMSAQDYRKWLENELKLLAQDVSELGLIKKK